MIIFKYITLLEQVIKKESERNLQNAEALENIKLLMEKIDYEAEEIVLTSEEKFIGLLDSLKGEPLTASEKEIAIRIIKIKHMS